jgi:hypothetical protein
MILDGIYYATEVATGERSDDFHNASSPITVTIPSVLVDASNVEEYYEPESIY